MHLWLYCILLCWFLQWELVCERESLAVLLPYITAVAAMIGALATGVLADKYGRKYVLILSLLFHTSFGVFLHFLPLYGIFVTVFSIQGFLIAVSIYLCYFLRNLNREALFISINYAVFYFKLRQKVVITPIPNLTGK